MATQHNNTQAVQLGLLAVAKGESLESFPLYTALTQQQQEVATKVWLSLANIVVRDPATLKRVEDARMDTVYELLCLLGSA